MKPVNGYMTKRDRVTTIEDSQDMDKERHIEIKY